MAWMAYLYLKHRIATSKWSGPISRIRSGIEVIQSWRHPELGLLKCEGWMQETVLQRLLKQNSNCIDVGAHLGSFTYSIFQFAPTGNHTVVEAIPYKAEWLRARFPTANVHASAVSNGDGEISFFENIDRPGFSSIIKGNGRHKEYKIVRSTLDELIPSDRITDFIKVDVEGHEWEVIQGAKRILQDSRPVIMFEAGPINIPGSSKYLELFAFLTDQMGYDVYAVFDFYYGRPPLAIDAFQSYRTYPFLSFNYLACPKSRYHNGQYHS